MQREKQRFRLMEILLTVGFFVFLVFLATATIYSTYSPTLFDAISLTNVTDITAPVQVTRGLFEPFLGSLYTMTRNEIGAIVLILVGYVVIRSVLLLFNRYRYHGALLTHPWVRQLTKAITVSFGISLLVVSVPLVYIVYTALQSGWANDLIPLAEICIYIAFAMTAFSIFYSIIRIRKGNLKRTRESSGKIRKFMENLRQSYQKTPKLVKTPIHELKSAIIVFLYAFILIEAAAWAPMPHYTVQGNLAPNEVLFDFHSHTTWSDGRLSPEDRVIWYMQHGLNGAAITDHNSRQGSLEAKAFVDSLALDFTVIVGEEYTASGIHMNIYGLNETIVPIGQSCDPECLQLNVSDTIAYVKAHGGYITVNHYASPAVAPYAYEQLRDWGVDGFEIVNGRHPQAPEIRQFCLDNNLICIGGTDIHGNDPVTCITKITLPDPQNRSVDAIFTAMRANTHQVIIYDQAVNPLAAQFGVLSGVASYFLTLSIPQSISWMIWIAGTWVITIICYRKGREINK